MNTLRHLILLARALDYDKDPDPKHWKTINGSHVHLDKNGNYDGGAGNKFNGSHHYGQGWKEKQNKPKRRSAFEIIYNYEKGPDVKTLPIQKLEDRMKKASTYGEWNQARGEIVLRLQAARRYCSIRFNNAYKKPEQKAIGEELSKIDKALEDFRKKSAIPTKFMEEAFERDPEKAEKAYREKSFLNEDFYPAYEKWIAKKDRVSSALGNLEKIFKKEHEQYHDGANIKFQDGTMMEIHQSNENPNEFYTLGPGGRTVRKWPGGMMAFLEKAKQCGATVSPKKLHEFGIPEPVTRMQRRDGRVNRQIRRTMKYGRPPGAR